uniref:Uncharacterized protein n=1 Tax=Anguilla anguilla TaxID=7936 RepID=A0A0E9U8Z7_ANGAN
MNQEHSRPIHPIHPLSIPGYPGQVCRSSINLTKCLWTVGGNQSYI